MFFRKPDYKFTALVKSGDNYFLVDSTDTFDVGYELMVFAVEKGDGDMPSKTVEKSFGGNEECSVLKFINDRGWDVNWTDLYSAHYNDMDEAEKDFDRVVDALYNGKFYYDGDIIEMGRIHTMYPWE